MTPNDLNVTSKESYDPDWPLKTWNSDSWQTKIKLYEEKTKQMEELEAKKRAKERLKKATMHREDIDEMRRVFKIILLFCLLIGWYAQGLILIGRKRHLASVNLKILFSKLKRKLAIVNSKIKYYWFHISERISRVVQKETVHNPTCKVQRV